MLFLMGQQNDLVAGTHHREFLLCNGYSLGLINSLSPTLCFGSCSCMANRYFPSNITNHERTHVPQGTVDSMALSRVHVFF